MTRCIQPDSRCECADCVRELAELWAIFDNPPPAWDGPKTKHRSVAPMPGEIQPRLMDAPIKGQPH